MNAPVSPASLHDTPRKILLAGAGTHIGKRLLQRLKKDNALFFTFNGSLENSEEARHFFSQTQPHVAIFCDIDSGGIEYIRKHPVRVINNNLIKYLNFLEAAHASNTRKIVNLISNSTYPSRKGAVLREDEWWDGPLHASAMMIGMARKTSWVQSCAYQQEYEMQFSHLIVGNIYGPEDYFDEERSYVADAMVGKILGAMKRGESSVTIWGSGNPVRDFIYVDDLVDAVMAATERDCGSEPINIGSGQGIAVKDLAALIREIAGFSGALQYDASKQDGAPYKVMDIGRAKKILEWEPRTALREGLTRTIAWCRTQSI